MRNHSRIAWRYAFFGISFLVHGEVCFAQNAGSGSMDMEISQMEDIWNQGDRGRYYSKGAAIAKEIKVKSSKANLNGPAAKLLGSLLAKQVNPEEAGTSDLSTMRDLAAYLASNDDVPIDERRLTASLLCKCLGKVRKEKVPNFMPKPVVSNVAPPPDVPGFAGMSPDAIKDPAAREKYKSAIRENQDNARNNSRQREIKRVEWAVSKKLKSYLPRAFKARDISMPVLPQCLNDAGFNDQERKEIENQLKRTEGE